MDGIKKCINGHFFREDLEKCPFCTEENDKNNQTENKINKKFDVAFIVNLVRVFFSKFLKKLKFSKNEGDPFFSFLKNKTFYFHFVLASFTTILLFFAWLKYIDYETGHGEEFPLKNYQSVDVHDLESLSEQDNITFVIIDSVYTDSVDKGTVFTQDPLPNTFVKEGRKIYLTINSQNTQKFFVPDVFNKSEREAVVNLTENFRVNLIKNKNYSEESSVVTSLKVGGVEIFAGQELLKGTMITVIFGNGRNMNIIPVPDLTGADLNLSQLLLHELSLKVGEISYEGVITDSLMIVVVKQYPTSERKLQSGDEVDLYFKQVPDTSNTLLDE